MKRRSFFKSLGLAAAAIATGAAVLPTAAKAATIPWEPARYIGEFEFVPDPFPMRFKMVDGELVQVNSHVYIKAKRTLVPNPEWENARYERRYVKIKL